MPGVLTNGDASRSRKRKLDDGKLTKTNSRKAPKVASADNTQEQILLLEEQILESRENYNNIVELQTHTSTFDKRPKTATLAAVALCRVFCRLIAGEKLVKHDGMSKSDKDIATWLKERLRDYVRSLTGWIGSPDGSKESTALTLLMRIVKSETSGTAKNADQTWRSDKATFYATINALLCAADADCARQEFVESYLEEHDDVRFYTFLALRKCLSEDIDGREVKIASALEILAQIEEVPESGEQLEDWYGSVPTGEKHTLLSLKDHRKVAREAWLAVFRSPLSAEQRKAILGLMNTQLLAWFADRLELLADFLTDSFNHGGSVSLLALNGIFHLMTQKSLDYPDFYMKLYSLLGEDIMHSKHRSRFFRLLETFMNSTHLPAAMVASFIKRLSRLSLQAPPGAIVWVVPWVYNMMKQHPPCTFMLHRTHHPAHAIYASNPKYEEEGMDDPFDMQQPNPMITSAIDSSLWEMVTLQSHFHPNVATLAKILGEQFTKRDYQLEDFLDHSYASLIDAELGKEMKKVPVVEWEIPKRIVTTEEGGLNDIGALLQSAIDAS